MRREPLPLWLDGVSGLYSVPKVERDRQSP